MSAPTLLVRRAVLTRDGHQCAACGAIYELEFQHRQASGMGGVRRRPEPHEGLTLCEVCNELVEGPMQARALLYGWKVRRWVQSPWLVPVRFFAFGWQWLGKDGGRSLLSPEAARVAMVDVYGPEYMRWENAA